MEVDHIFIFSDILGEEANDLVRFGFTEGSSRIHPGQGTINRKFYFDNFFLEILWVYDEKEIKNATTSKIKLWERSLFKKNNYSRFGLCLVNTKSTDKLFEQSTTYQPEYFPEGFSIDVITNEDNKVLPWTFRLPIRKDGKVDNEPREHKNQIKSLTRAIFEVHFKEAGNSKRELYNKLNHIVINESERTHVTLEFDNCKQNKEKNFSHLNLTIRY